MRLLLGCKDSNCVKELVCNVGANTAVKGSDTDIYLGSSQLVGGSQNAIDRWVRVIDDDSKFVFARSNGTLQLCERKAVVNLESVEEDASKVPLFKWEVIMDFNESLFDQSVLDSLMAASNRRTKMPDAFVTLCWLKKGVLLAATKSGLVHIISVSSKNKITKTCTHKVKAPLEFVQLYDNTTLKDKYVFATGGEENLVKLFDLDKTYQKLNQIWEAKNVKNDRLDMKVPIWPMQLRFLDPEPVSSAENEGELNFQFAVVTRWSHLGIYQTRHGRKPLRYIDLFPGREPLTSLEFVGETTANKNLKSSNIKEFSFVTTDTKHGVWKFNAAGTLLGKYGKSDIVGAPTFISICHDEGYLLQGGLDRYVRVFDVQSLRTLAKVYTPSKVNLIELLDNKPVQTAEPVVDKQKTKQKRKRVIEETEEDVDKLWDTLESKAKKIKE
ncbi:ribosome biosynthesis protein NSA1 KNAG_0M00690 [Huiozyma naganishii CBS 8797]|uniref:Ribosome biogenesis protein NSA1 n=1 Tax=Huiozyma naganishii (strain ATCC MYA-139 / BCRC 22969 / CBS 8797 / KCTC 17520 / NBRC 10181 / NCYC 3082 / Yp74L-3) TaxID=1071383 RepID=J7S3Z7_HUIN7|nr:hypothetical protein KNAG_0M00690 [Kazachstania naganishii CBS 8797]CCK72922.1 hypothetical protein KNAG_0M00690 [Kazachstania naganishii CBS 8797]